MIFFIFVDIACCILLNLLNFWEDLSVERCWVLWAQESSAQFLAFDHAGGRSDIFPTGNSGFA